MNVIAHKMKNKHIQIIYEPFGFFYTPHNIWKDFSIFHNLFFKGKAHNNFKSYNGYTDGWISPHEGGKFFNRFK